METLVGRKAETKILTDALKSGNPELVAMYGRRRIGKTFLIHSVYEKHILFEFSGIHEARLDKQLLNFSLAMMDAAKSKERPDVPTSWVEAFHILKEYLAPKLKGKKSVIFFDEFPWIQTPRSGFLTAFDHFWNTWASRQKNLVVVICGSAAAWMIRNIVNNKGGLHNRITQKIRLLPFELSEVEEYLKSIGAVLDRYQILQLYMALGGVPQYLKNIKPGESAAQIIDRFCFAKEGALKNEFSNLYQSLFDNPDNHIAVIRALAQKGKGLSRNEIIDTCALSSGGTTTKLLEELVESGFITPYLPFEKNVKDSVYKLSDEYSLFYLKFMDGARGTGAGTWLRLSESASWRSWSGFAFEDICLKHSIQIKKALGITGVLTEESVWRYTTPEKNERGVQIDLVIDRSDHCINICELKFSTNEFIIDKDYAAKLKEKLDVFKTKTKSKKALFLTMVTTYGVKKNIQSIGLVQSDITMNDLFEER